MCMIPYRFELLPMGSLRFTGMFDRAIRFVQERQLKDPPCLQRAGGGRPRGGGGRMTPILPGAANIGEN